MIYDELSESDRQSISDGYCPSCGHRGFVFGPKGGHSMNIECSSLTCRARFNIARVFVSGDVVFPQRIPRESKGGTDWGKPLRPVKQ